MMEAAYVIEGTRTINASLGYPFPQLSNQGNLSITNTDTLFAATLTVSGDGYTTTMPPAQYSQWTSTSDGPFRKIDPDNWYLPYKTDYWRYPATFTVDDTTLIFNGADNGPPAQVVYWSLDGGAFTTSGITSDNKGKWYGATGPVVTTPGAHILRVKVGNEVYGPSGGIPFTVAAAAAPYFYATQTVAQLIGAVVTVMTFDTVVSNVQMSWNAGTSTLTVVQPGVYHISGNAVVQSTATAIFACGIIINGTNIANGVLTQVPGAGMSQGSHFDMSVQLAAGGTIQFAALSGPAATTNGLGVSNWFTVTRLHA
jgi:hypothetical protein